MKNKMNFTLLLVGIAMMLNTNLPAANHKSLSPVYGVEYKDTSDGPLLLDLYYPAAVAPVAGYPLVVYTHGGGWAKGERRIPETGLKRMAVDALNAAGFCVASVEYRLCTRDGRIVMRDCIVDAKDALRYLAKNADTLSLDSQRICSFGDSAGAHISQIVLLSPAASFAGDPALADAAYRLVAGVSWYGPSDFEKTGLFTKPDGTKGVDRFGDRILRGDEDAVAKLAAYREISPVNYLKADSPALLMMQGELDPTMPIAHAEYMAERAAAVDAPVTIEIVKNRTHNWNPQDAAIEPSLDEIIRTTVQFMQKHVEGALTPGASASRVIWRDLPGLQTPGFDKPFKSWQNDGFPIGNGRLGCMVFGGIQEDPIQFNVDSLWTGDQNLGGKYKGATFGAYQNFGDLFVELDGGPDYKDYRRELDIEQALCSVTYLRDGVKFEREYFCSNPGDLIAARYTANREGQYSGRIRLAGAHKETTQVDGSRMTFSGKLDNGLDYEAQLAVVADGGQLKADGDELVFSGCDSLTLYLAADTSYVSDYAQKFMGKHPHERVAHAVELAAAHSFDELKAAHQSDYSTLYDRVRLDIGSTHPDQLALPMDRRLGRIRDEDVADPDLEELLFQYGRYLLISCSRAGALPANLQGLWNYSNNPRWLSDYHSNINLQMNYWGAEPANLSECHTPLLDMLNASLEPFRQGTRLEFGDDIRGFTIRTSHNPYGGMGWKWNIPASAWYARHFWEHYAFGGDKEFLAQVAYPYLKEVCHYWEDHLKELPPSAGSGQAGRLVAPDGWSPEHGPREDGVAHDQQIIWDLFSNTIKASEELGIDEDYRQTLAGLRDRLVGPKVGSWGQLQEWMEDRDDPECQHRHTSQLYAVYPGYQVSRSKTPKFAEAAAVSLKARGESGDSRREWAWTWRTALWARLGNAEMAHHMIRSFFKYNMLDNLVGVHPPLQIDGSLGITGSMCEMLLQSHAGEIQLLPSLPKAWATGHVKGLRARGGFTVDIEWKDGKLVEARIRADRKGTCSVRYGDRVETGKLEEGKVWRVASLHADGKPNIIYINADDLGWMDLSCQGSTYYETPNIDRLAKQGMRFTDAYAPAANCAPSRAACMSGQYTPRHGVYTVNGSDRGKAKDRKLIPTKNTTTLADANVTMAEALKAAGYATIHLGKWHIGKDPCTQGFDVNIGGSHDGGPYRGKYISPYTYPNCEQKNEGEYLTDRLGTEAISFINTHRDKPFFMYLSTFSIHTPFEPKPEKLEYFQKKQASVAHQNAAYAATIFALDENVGRVMDELDKLGLSENTLVLFTSDNGGVYKVSKQWPLREGKGAYYEGGIREPLIVRWLGKIKPGSECSVPVIGIDYFPTFLEVADASVPQGKVLDGVSLMPLLTGSGAIKDRALYWHFPIYLQGGSEQSRDPLFRTRPGSAIRYGDWKLQEYFEDGALELFNLKDDLGEKTNLATSHPEKAQELHGLLKAWRKEVNAPVPTELNPEYQP